MVLAMATIYGGSVICIVCDFLVLKQLARSLGSLDSSVRFCIDQNFIVALGLVVIQSKLTQLIALVFRFLFFEMIINKCICKLYNLSKELFDFGTLIEFVLNLISTV